MLDRVCYIFRKHGRAVKILRRYVDVVERRNSYTCSPNAFVLGTPTPTAIPPRISSLRKNLIESIRGRWGNASLSTTFLESRARTYQVRSLSGQDEACLEFHRRWSLDISWPGIDRHNRSASSAAPIRPTVRPCYPIPSATRYGLVDR